MRPCRVTLAYLTDPRERPQREDPLDRHLEVARDPERQVERGAVLAPPQVAHRLIVHAERIGRTVLTWIRAADHSSESARFVASGKHFFDTPQAAVA